MVVVAAVLLIGPYMGEEVSKHISSHRTGKEGGYSFIVTYIMLVLA